MNAGRTANISDGTYSNAAAIPAATNIELDTFLASHTNGHSAATALPSTPAPAGPVLKKTVEAMFENGAAELTLLRNGGGKCQIIALQPDGVGKNVSDSIARLVNIGKSVAPDSGLSILTIQPVFVGMLAGSRSAV